MNRFVYGVLLHCLVGSSVYAQEKPDTTSHLEEVQVKAYFADRPLLLSPASAAVLGAGQLKLQPDASLVTAVNTLPGVRMEERSPGSYRLSIRGSLLRSPFGIRNIKVYMDEFPLTDAGGNTYLNLLDAGSTGRIEILKGPEGSIFGANSGGVVLLGAPAMAAPTAVSASLSGGSYGLFHERVQVQQSWEHYQLSVNQGYQRSDGYRENSALRRHYADVWQQWNYSPSANLRSLVLFSDLNYRTPGGLTATQAELDPRAARPAAGTTPGAVAQQAGIFNRTFLAGITHETRFAKRFRHVLAVSGMHTDFRNPFITNYEVRKENSMNLRTYAELKDSTGNVHWRSVLGFEAQQTFSDFDNYGNKLGIRDNLMTADKLRADQDFAFTHLSFDIRNKLVLEAAASFNVYSYRYSSSFPSDIPARKRRFDNQLMPRLALSYLLSPQIALRASVSRGYSPPAIAEVRASDNVINTTLQPETGWNHEAGFRYRNNRLWLDASVFRYHLQDAIVRRLNASDQEYFINAGGTRQTGVESQLAYWLVQVKPAGWIRGLQARNSYTYSHYLFSNYQNADDDFSGNALTGVPRHVVVSSLEILLPGNTYLFAQHNYTGKIPLNDGNTAYSRRFNLLQFKTGRRWTGTHGYHFELYAGADNLFNEKYSLGNDLNAFGGRYFNPSPGRNYYAGITVGLKQ